MRGDEAQNGRQPAINAKSGFFFDDETCRLESTPNSFGVTLLPVSPE
jgi:hypothetical protein